MWPHATRIPRSSCCNGRTCLTFSSAAWSCLLALEMCRLPLGAKTNLLLRLIRPMGIAWTSMAQPGLCLDLSILLILTKQTYIYTAVWLRLALWLVLCAGAFFDSFTHIVYNSKHRCHSMCSHHLFSPIDLFSPFKSGQDPGLYCFAHHRAAPGQECHVEHLGEQS